MNQNNVMAFVQSRVPVKGVSGRMPGIRSKMPDAGSFAERNFQEVMGTSGSDGRTDIPRNADVMEDVPQDPIAAAIAATQQTAAQSASQGDFPQEEVQVPEETVQAVDDVPLVEHASQGRMAMGDVKPSPALHSLLLPSEEAGAKGQQMLAVLSGQTFQKVGQNDNVTTAVNLQSVTQEWKPMTATDMISAQTAQLARENVQFSGMPNQRAESQQFVFEMAPVTEGEMTLSLSENPMRNGSNVGALVRQAEPAGFVKEAAGFERMPDVLNNMPAGNQGNAVQDFRNPFLQDVRQIQVQDMPLQSGGEAQQSAGISVAGQAEQMRDMPQTPVLAINGTDRQVLMPNLAADKNGAIPLAQEVVVGADANNARPGMEQFSQQPGQNLFDQQQARSGDFRPVVGDEPVAEGTRPLKDTGSSQTISSFQQVLQNAEQVQEAQPQQQPVRDTYEIQRQIVEQARLIRTEESTEMVIRLKPEHLGDMTLRISVTANGSVNASFHSDNAYVRSIIENSLVQLRQELNNQGIKVDNVEVSAQLPDGQMQEGQGQQAWQEAGRSRQGSLMADAQPNDMDAFEEMNDGMVADAAAGGSVSPEGVDYRV